MSKHLFIGRLPRRGEEKKKFWKTIIDFSNKNNAYRINVCSSSANILFLHSKRIKMNELAPAKSTEITLENGTIVKNVTALWKYSKVHTCHYDSILKKPTQEWFDRRTEGWKNGKTKSHLPRNTPFSKQCNVWFNGKPMNFTDARKMIWIKYYVKLYKNHPAFIALKQLYSTKSVLLLDFSCHSTHHLSNPTKNEWENIINDPEIPLGHSYILYGMLKGWL